MQRREGGSAPEYRRLAEVGFDPEDVRLKSVIALARELEAQVRERVAI